MYQDFKVSSRPEQGPPRLGELRARMAETGIDAFLVPRADAHQGEYVADRDARLAWLTGFSGSAGMAVVTRDETALFVDGRYTIQARGQVADEIAVHEIPGRKPADWLVERLSAGAVLGFDAWLHTRAEIDRLEAALAGRDVALRAIDNPVDAIWTDQPGPPMGRITAFPDEIAGKTRAGKCAEIAKDLRDAGHAWAVLTLPDSICWLLNVRGSDIPRIPIAQGFALVEAATGEVRLFVHSDKIDADLLPGVEILPPESLNAALATLGGPVRLDRDTAPVILGRTLEEAGIEVAWATDPCILPKARKTDAEIEASRQAHLRDGAAMCEFLYWLDGRLADVLVGERLTEIDVVRALERFRRETGELRDISFDTIAGTGPNGAITHYRVSEESDRAVSPGDLLLVDSGGQYLDGTTDITRTMAVGDPDPEQVAAFTRVLQGMIAISHARWPKGLAGRDLDALARAPLWMAGQDYGHGTGHGVGVFLSVHEGPQRLSRQSEVPFEPGMIVSNEPGYYREGAWGIRTENLVVVVEAEPLPDGDAHREMLAFETLTWVPIDRRLIDIDTLSPAERAWIDAYHSGVANRMAGRLSPEATEWIGRVTAPLCQVV
ncbi:aminopeptidase P family protein [Palleronia sp. LCG004]|uniref:aminopeptidase P family protein n=1 Tax=Palleronia sp. LCG004 TaxID=3079304 RepID=UPI002941EC07|nr:aminopeptidase P family protein [Palleronia sp. LCG004]WOI55310.1 aminopeptidase P family protein [Palleronia sp. LCG004]